MKRTRREGSPAPASRRSPASDVPISDPITSLAAAVAVFALLFPTLARTPQNGDGAELILTASRGGVPHPPGFPLQAWLDRALAALPGVSTALSISALG